VERKNGWQLAEQAGELTPDGMQRLLNSAVWDADGVRDDVRDYVVENLGDPDGVLVLDETGFLKKGTKSAGVARQYSGTAGRIENCQIGVFLTYVTAAGRSFLDRELYLPQSWTGDEDRCREAGIGGEVAFATKPQLAKAMLARALAGKVPARWVTADEVYGCDRRLRMWLEAEGIGHVMAVKSNESLIGATSGHIFTAVRARTLADEVADEDWQTLSAGDGEKGPRLYQWARVPIRPLREKGVGHWLLIRRSLTDSSKRAFYVCYGPAETTLTELVRIAGSRWSIEECFQTAKGEVGLDHYQVRRYDAWYRHITLSMLAHAYLTVTRATQHTAHSEKGVPEKQRN